MECKASHHPDPAGTGLARLTSRLQDQRRIPRCTLSRRLVAPRRTSGDGEQFFGFSGFCWVQFYREMVSHILQHPPVRRRTGLENQGLANRLQHYTLCHKRQRDPETESCFFFLFPPLVHVLQRSADPEWFRRGVVDIQNIQLWLYQTRPGPRVVDAPSRYDCRPVVLRPLRLIDRDVLKSSARLCLQRKGSLEKRAEPLQGPQYLVHGPPAGEALGALGRPKLKLSSEGGARTLRHEQEAAKRSRQGASVRKATMYLDGGKPHNLR